MTRPPQRADLERLAQRLEKGQEVQFDRFSDMIRDIDAKFSSLQASVRMGDFSRERLSSDVNELALQLSDLRDAVGLRRTEEVHVVAEETAGATVERARPVIAHEARRAAKLSPLQKSGLGGIAFVALVEFIDKGPKLAKAIIAFVKGLANLA